MKIVKLKKEGILKNDNKGITLITLITTIIILLILAGISITVLTGDNGLINKAAEAKNSSEKSEEKEMLDQAVVVAMGKNKRGNLKNENLIDELNNYPNIETVEGFDDGVEVMFKSKRCYFIDTDGNVSDVEIADDKSPGDITKDKDGNELNGDDKPYEIWSIEDLVTFSNMVSGTGSIIDNGTARAVTNADRDKLNNAKVSLMTTLNFKSRYSYIDAERTDFGDINGNEEDGNKLLNEMTTGTGFRPIGFNSDHGFTGEFDGKNNSILNIYINYENQESTKPVGLFSLASGSINNLIISGNIKNNWYTGGIDGNTSGNLTIKNCTNMANITGFNIVGGILGRGKQGNIDNCVNYGKIEITGFKGGYSYNGNGGIMGTVYNLSGESFSLNNCVNHGEICGFANSAGIMSTKYSSGEVKLTNCTNYGKVKNSDETTDIVAGGIVSRMYAGTMFILNCGNEGDVVGKGTKGGIISICNGPSYSTEISVDINNSYNIGKVVSYNNSAGGIISQQSKTCAKNNITITNVYTSEEITGTKSGAILASRSKRESTEQSLNLTNVYYSNDNPFGNGVDYSTEGSIKKSESEIKSTEFIDLLNLNIGTNTEWNSWKMSNKGFPIH